MVIQKVDIEDILEKAKKGIEKNRLQRTDLLVVQDFWEQTKHYDLRDLPPEKRVSESQRLVKHTLELYTRAFVSFTVVENVPTREQLKNRHEYTQRLQKQYAKAHGNPCSRSDVAALKRIVGDFISIYAVQDGLDKLEDFQRQGKTIKWEKAFDKGITVGRVGNFAENIIKVSEQRNRPR